MLIIYGLQVFKVFGEITEVTVEPVQGYALVQFADIVAAFMAQQSLNNFYLNKYNASLSVKWVIKKDNKDSAGLPESNGDPGASSPLKAREEAILQENVELDERGLM